MSVSHHLTDETIQDYSAGSLSSPMETLVACHLTVCRQCRQKASLADEVGGSLFDVVQPVQMSLTAAELITRAAAAQSDGGQPCDSPASRVPAPAHQGLHASQGPARVPRPLARLLPAPLDKLEWRKIAPGIRQHNLSDQHRRHGAFQLLHLDPGVVLSAHSHNDRELTFLVQGSYHDELGHFKAGDIADLEGNHTHQPIIDSDIPCIALIATQSPVRYTGVFGKIMQPFVGI